MTQLDRPDAFFIADHCALDFLNSIAEPSSVEYEWLASGQDLLDWLLTAELVPARVFKEFSNKKFIKELDEVAHKARKLREWLRDFVIRHAGSALEPVSIKELKSINKLLSGDCAYTQIELNTEQDEAYSTTPLVINLNRQWSEPNSLLFPLAEIISDLVCHVDFSQIKNCEGPTCSLWFYDVSKNHGRRWCTMSVCGNRAKAAAHRAKKRAAKKLE